MKITLNLLAFIPVIPLIPMVVSAHNGDLAWVCAWGFISLFLLLFFSLHDIHITLWGLLQIFDEAKDGDYEEN